jgi:CBS domain-containing protein
MRLEEAALSFFQQDANAFPVVDADGNFVGLITLDDLRRTPRDSWTDRHVADVMVPAGALPSVAPGVQVLEALRLLAERDTECLPVLEEGRLVGLIHRRDITRYLDIHLPRGEPPRRGVLARP